jgi:hypothetical protein
MCTNIRLKYIMVWLYSWAGLVPGTQVYSDNCQRRGVVANTGMNSVRGRAETNTEIYRWQK